MEKARGTTHGPQFGLHSYAPMSAAHNPFRSERVTSLRFLPPNTTWEALMLDLEARKWRGAIVGPCGSGKTTLLENLASELENRGFAAHFYRLSSEIRGLPASFWKRSWDAHDAVLLDGAEQLGFAACQRLRRRLKSVGAVIITSHRPRLLPTWLRTSTSPALLRELAGQLGVELDEPQSETLFWGHQGNLRNCLLQLYDDNPCFP